MKKVFIEIGTVTEAAQLRRIGNTVAVFQVAFGFGDAEVLDIVLNAHVHSVFEQSGQVTSVEIEVLGDLGNRDLSGIGCVNDVDDTLHIVGFVLLLTLHDAVDQIQVAGQTGG